MKTIAFMNQKGGVGKTTTAVSFGSILANEHGKKVLLIDLDPQGNMSDHVGIDPNDTERSIYDVILGHETAEAVLEERHGMGVLPANLDLSGAEIELAGMMSRELRLKNAVDNLCAGYDYILLDCPPSLGLLTISGLTMADEVIVPMQAEYLAMRGLTQLIHSIELVREHLNETLFVSGVLFCMYDGRTNLAQAVKGEVEAYFPGKAYKTAIRKNVRLAEAPSYGKPIDQYDPNCAGTLDYRAVVAEFLSRAGDGDNDPSRREPIWRGDAMRPETVEEESPHDSMQPQD